MPAPRWAVVAWLLAPMRSIGSEGDAELRQSMLRRLDAILVSATLTLGFAVLAFVQHPILPMGIWLALEVTLAAVRMPVIFHMLRFSKHPDPGRALPPWITDAFVCLGTLWSTLLGLGTLFCLSTRDPGLSIIATLVAMGTIGAQGARNPGSPRLNCVQMCLIVLPFTVGTLFSAIPLVRWTLILIPMYLIGMMSITRQLHEDYVALLLARIENRNRALHCSLTGLPNRAYFKESLEAALEGAAANKDVILVMYLDLDGFKAVNDRFGHAAGDTLLTQVAGRLNLWSRSQNLVARLGGDEFAVLLSTDDRCQAEIEAQALIDSLRCPYELGLGRVAQIGVSIGLASGAPGLNPTALTARADAALYEAKQSGKGTFRWIDNVPFHSQVSADAFAAWTGGVVRHRTEDRLADGRAGAGGPAEGVRSFG